MNSNRRDFMKVATAGIPLAALVSCGYAQEERLKDSIEVTQQIGRDRKQIFNMSGYAAPALNHLRVGYIGLGNRGFASLKRLARMEGVEIVAIADCYEYPIVCARQWLKEHKCPAPAEYYASEETWKDLVARDDLDFIYIATPPYWHAVMALHAMLAGKHVATEVPMTMILEDCWKLVETSEKTKKHCTMLENCCYGDFETMTINMALQGVLGDIVHGEGAYIHYFPQQFQMAQPPLSPKSAPYYGWVTSTGKGNRYPTHGLGPVCQAMKINCGDRLEYLTSVETDDFVRSKQVKELAAKGNPMYASFKDRVYVGNMNSSLIRTMNGKTILVQYDTVDPRPYSRIHLLSGCTGFVQKYPLPGAIYLDPHKAATEDEMKVLKEKYLPELIKHIGPIASKSAGHDGMDFTVDWRLVDCLRNGLPLDISVYDAATWSSILPLSFWSVLHRSQPIDCPDFTCGSWQKNNTVDLSLRGGGKTSVKPLS